MVALLLGSGLSSEVNKEGILIARKFKIIITSYYVSLRTRILEQAPFLNQKSNHQAKGRTPVRSRTRDDGFLTLLMNLF